MQLPKSHALCLGARAACPLTARTSMHLYWERGRLARNLTRSTGMHKIYVSPRKKPSGRDAMRMPSLVGIAFPQRVILTRFGRFVIHDSLVAIPRPPRHSLISGVADKVAARAASPKYGRHRSGSAGGSPATYPKHGIRRICSTRAEVCLSKRRDIQCLNFRACPLGFA